MLCKRFPDGRGENRPCAERLHHTLGLSSAADGVNEAGDGFPKTLKLFLLTYLAVCGLVMSDCQFSKSIVSAVPS